MSETPKEPAPKVKPQDGSKPNPKDTAETIQQANNADAAAKAAAQAIADAEAAAKEADQAEASAKEALEKAEAAKAAAEAAAEAEYKAIADEVKSKTVKGQDYTFKRQSEEIFKREMHEPEFFLNKKDRFPVPILSQQQQEDLTRQVEIPVDNTPKYSPERLLSPEFGGLSNYESGVRTLLDDARARLGSLTSDPDSAQNDIAEIERNIAYLESLHENYFLGMNVFRTAHGGRSRLKK